MVLHYSILQLPPYVLECYSRSEYFAWDHANECLLSEIRFMFHILIRWEYKWGKLGGSSKPTAREQLASCTGFLALGTTSINSL